MNLLKSIPKRGVKYIITGLVLLIGILVYMLFFSAPLYRWVVLHTELGLARQKLIDMEQALHRREQVESLCRKYEERILATGTDAEELGFLLKELESLTRARNVQVKKIRPMPSQWISNYRKFIVSLEVQGRVHNMLEFLYSIDTSPKILAVESLTIRALRSGVNLLSANILISRTSAGGKLKQQEQ